MKVSAVLKGSPDRDKRVPIVLRIADGKKRRYEKTSLRIEKGNFSNGRVTGPMAAEYNPKIKKLIVEKEMQLLEKTKRYADAEFFDYFDLCMKQWAQTKKYNTLRNFTADKNTLKKYRSTFMLSEITPEFLRGYAAHCKNNKGNTIWTKFKNIKTIVNKAVREGIIERNPMDRAEKPKYKDPRREFLSREQVQDIENWLPQSGPLQLCATWFAIGCYTGLRYGDMNAFDKRKHIKNGRLIIYTEKTGEPVSIAMSEKLRGLLATIGYQSLFISNQKYNSALKKIAEKCSIDAHITSHCSRHTFATIAATLGISIEVVARILGHRNIRHTAIYYKLANTRVDREMERFG